MCNFCKGTEPQLNGEPKIKQKPLWRNKLNRRGNGKKKQTKNVNEIDWNSRHNLNNAGEHTWTENITCRRLHISFKFQCLSFSDPKVAAGNKKSVTLSLRVNHCICYFAHFCLFFSHPASGFPDFPSVCLPPSPSLRQPLPRCFALPLSVVVIMRM